MQMQLAVKESMLERVFTTNKNLSNIKAEQQHQYKQNYEQPTALDSKQQVGDNT
jgi:hypothetical protein